MLVIQPIPNRADALPVPIDSSELSELLLSILQQADLGITIASAPDAMVVATSRHAAEVTGREVVDMVGQPSEAQAEHWHIHRPSSSTPATTPELPLTRAARRGEVVTDELWLVRGPDGIMRTVLCSAGPLRDRTGQIRWGFQLFREVPAALEPNRDRLAVVEAMLEVGNHRIRSSLGMAAALLRLHGASAPQPARRDLEAGAARLVAMAQLHGDLTDHGIEPRVDAASHLARVGVALQAVLDQPDRPASVTVHATPCELPGTTATCLAMLATELVTVARALPGPRGEPRTIEIRYRYRLGMSLLRVTSRDTDLPADFDPAEATGPAMRLIRSLVDRLHGQLTLTRGSSGARFDVMFPVPTVRDHGGKAL